MCHPHTGLTRCGPEVLFQDLRRDEIVDDDDDDVTADTYKGGPIEDPGMMLAEILIRSDCWQMCR